MPKPDLQSVAWAMESALLSVAVQVTLQKFVSLRHLRRTCTGLRDFIKTKCGCELDVIDNLTEDMEVHCTGHFSLAKHGWSWGPTSKRLGRLYGAWRCWLLLEGAEENSVGWAMEYMGETRLRCEFTPDGKPRKGILSSSGETLICQSGRWDKRRFRIINWSGCGTGGVLYDQVTYVCFACVAELMRRNRHLGPQPRRPLGFQPQPERLQGSQSERPEGFGC